MFALSGNDWLDSHGSWGKDHLYGGAGDGTDRCRTGRTERNCELTF